MDIATNQAVLILFQFLILIFSIVIHEVSHGAVAYALGDPTAKNAGRLTLNPISHVDFVGSILMPIITAGRFGWAKPVPYNPYNLKNQKWGPLVVGVAGPASNILVAVFFGLLMRFGTAWPALSSSPLFFISAMIVVLNLQLAFFNLIPIPPLDGSKVFLAIIPYSWRGAAYFLERYGLFILLILVFIFPSVLLNIVIPIVAFLFRLLTGAVF